MSFKLTFYNIFLIIILLSVLILTTNHLWHKDILFHTDLARDFLVMQDMVENKKPTLIGPRSGGISGVFHGPAWYYISLVPFILTKGDPVMMGWFWWLIGLSAVGCFFVTSFKIGKNLNSSLLSSICFSLILLPQAASPVNNYIADLFSFFVFFLWLEWWKKPTLLRASIAWFLLGMLVQFQMAFAVPIAVILGPIFLYKIIKLKKYKQALSLIAFLIPLSTFFLFEIRHDWLQLRSVLAYLNLKEKVDYSLIKVLVQRIISISGDGLNIFKISPSFLSAPIMLAFWLIGVNNKKKSIKLAVSLTTYAYLFWWILTIFYSGTVWGYYFSPFFGIFLLVINLISSNNRKAKLILLMATILLISRSKGDLIYKEGRFNSSSWKLLKTMAAESLNKQNLGYFVYSQDQFAYSLKYAFYLQNKQDKDINAAAFVKKEETILIKASDDPRNPYSTSKDWQVNRIRINQEPKSIKYYEYGYQVETYELNKETIDQPIDPNLITNLHFR